MKKTVFLTLCGIFYSGIVFGQGFLLPSWSKHYIDTTLDKSQAKISIIYTIDAKEGNLYLCSNSFIGWTIQKIDASTGNVTWYTSRNQNYPTKGNNLHFMKNFFLRDDGKLEVLGVKGYGKYPLFLSNSGAITRSVYDIKNGKEILYQYDSTRFSHITGFIGNPFIRKKNKEYYFLDVMGGKRTLRLTTLDSNLIVKDTLAFFSKGISEDQPSLSLNSGQFNECGNILCGIEYFFGGKYDTTATRHVFIKYNKLTKKAEEKEISKNLLYYNENVRFANISDGFLHTGYTDSTLSILKKVGKNPWYIGKVSKIDTNGVVLWNTFLPHPKPTNLKYYGRIISVEDIARNGYWIFAGNEDADTIPMSLFFINKLGKIQKTAYYKKKPLKDVIIPYTMFSLSNGDLLTTFRYFNCGASYDTCSQAVYFKKELLDNILSSNDAIVDIENLESGLFFPNPCSDIANIRFNKIKSGSLDVFNIQGQKITSIDFQNQNEIKFSTLNYFNGFYIAYLNFDDKTRSVHKFIVTH
jgi:hypothetical protein